VIGGDEAGALGDRDEGAEVIKKIDEEEDEDDFKQTLVESAANVEFEGVAARAWKPPGLGASGRDPPPMELEGGEYPGDSGGERTPMRMVPRTFLFRGRP